MLLATVLLLALVCPLSARAQAPQPSPTPLTAPPPLKVIPKEERLQLDQAKDLKQRLHLSMDFAGGHLTRAGQDVTLVAHGKMVNMALKAAEEMAKDGIQAEVVDPRTIRPLDVPTIAASVKKTNRCVIVDEGWPFAGVGAQFAYDIQKEAFDFLDAPVLRVTAADVPMPYNKQLEKLAKPDVAKIAAACRQVLYQA